MNQKPRLYHQGIGRLVRKIGNLDFIAFPGLLHDKSNNPIKEKAEKQRGQKATLSNPYSYAVLFSPPTTLLRAFPYILLMVWTRSSETLQVSWRICNSFQGC